MRPDVFGSEGPKRSNPYAGSSPGRTGSSPAPGTAGRPTNWREALLPKPPQQQAAAPSGTYTTDSNGQFVFTPTATSGAGLTDATGQALANIYFYQQPIAPYSPGSRYVGIGTLEQRATGAHLGSLAKATTIGEALQSYWSDPEARSAIVSAAREHYAGNPNFTEQWAENFWADLVNIAASTGINPASILDKINSGELTLNNSSASPAGYSPYGGSYGGGGYGGGGGGQVSLTNPTSARGLLLQTMQGVLGRNPTEQEYKQFIKALTEAEMGAPRTVDFEGDLAVQSGGVDPGMVAMEYVEGLEEFDSAAGQRAFGAFMQVLGA